MIDAKLSRTHDTLATNARRLLRANDTHQVMTPADSGMHFAVKGRVKRRRKCPLCACFTWSLEVDASHLHWVGGVMGGNICVVQQALCSRLRLFSFTTGEQPGDKKKKITFSTQRIGWGGMVVVVVGGC